MRIALGLALLAGLTGCATPAAWRAASLEPVERVETPFFPQADYQCGPAALATVLASQIPYIDPEALVPEVYIPARQGSLQPELLASVRRRALVPVPVPPSLEGVSSALQAGAPVLVLQNLGLRSLPVWHYAVVIGLDPLAPAVLLRSGTTKREVLTPRRFLASWSRADRWGFTVHLPDDIPAWATSQDWLSTVAVWSRQGQVGPAREAAQAAIERWPEVSATWLALGNAEVAMDALPAAASAFERALALQPTAGGYNNLAFVLASLKCRTRARAVLDEGQARYPGFAPFEATAVRVAASEDACAR